MNHSSLIATEYFHYQFFIKLKIIRANPVFIIISFLITLPKTPQGNRKNNILRTQAKKGLSQTLKNFFLRFSWKKKFPIQQYNQILQIIFNATRTLCTALACGHVQLTQYTYSPNSLLYNHIAKGQKL